MRFSFEIEAASGDVFNVTSDARDVRAWESEYGQSFLDVPWSYTQAAQIAYLAGKRAGVFDGRYPSYKDFDADCTRVDAESIPKTSGNPIRPEATDAFSASSLSGSHASHPSSKRRDRTS